MNTVRFCYSVAAAAFMSLAVSSFDVNTANTDEIVITESVSAATSTLM